MRTLEIDQSASGSTQELAIGDQLRLTLPETRTAGFSWRMVSAASSVFRVGDNGFAPPGSVGGAGVHCWLVTAVEAGTAAFAMEYGRHWGSTPPARQFHITVKVVR